MTSQNLASTVLCSNDACPIKKRCYRWMRAESSEHEGRQDLTIRSFSFSEKFNQVHCAAFMDVEAAVATLLKPAPTAPQPFNTPFAQKLSQVMPRHKNAPEDKRAQKRLQLPLAILKKRTAFIKAKLDANETLAQARYAAEKEFGRLMNGKELQLIQNGTHRLLPGNTLANHAKVKRQTRAEEVKEVKKEPHRLCEGDGDALKKALRRVHRLMKPGGIASLRIYADGRVQCSSLRRDTWSLVD